MQPRKYLITIDFIFFYFKKKKKKKKKNNSMQYNFRLNVCTSGLMELVNILEPKPKLLISFLTNLLVSIINHFYVVQYMFVNSILPTYLSHFTALKVYVSNKENVQQDRFCFIREVICICLHIINVYNCSALLLTKCIQNLNQGNTIFF